MRHQRAGVHLSRTSAHRKALFSNLVAALFMNERIRTTDAKAKAARRLAERTITWARRLGEVLTTRPDRRSNEDSARVVHAMRMARRVVRDREALSKLFSEIGPRYLDRAGGYTRIVKIGQRPGDAAPMSLLELIPNDNAVAGQKSASTGDDPGKSRGKAEASASTEASPKKKAMKPARAEVAGKAKAKARPKAESGTPSKAKKK